MYKAIFRQARKENSFQHLENSNKRAYDCNTNKTHSVTVLFQWFYHLKDPFFQKQGKQSFKKKSTLLKMPLPLHLLHKSQVSCWISLPFQTKRSYEARFYFWFTHFPLGQLTRVLNTVSTCFLNSCGTVCKSLELI